MELKILEYLTSHRIGVLATTLKDGTPHTATLHYSHSQNPFEIYFSTSNKSRKCEEIVDRGSVKASFNTGFSEEEWVEVQMDGVVASITDAKELEMVHQIHYAKFPSATKWKDDPETLFLKFTPTWWRYTDFNTDPETVISSEK